jgi:hypothetical protein
MEVSMVVVRNVFRLKFGKTREAVALVKEGLAIQQRVLSGVEFSTRLLTDVTGPFYTLVLELTVPNLPLLKRMHRDSLETETGRLIIRS